MEHTRYKMKPALFFNRTFSISLLAGRLFTAAMILMPVQFAIAASNLRTGIEYFENGEYRKAHSLFADAQSQSVPEFHYYYGLSLYKTDQVKKAVQVMKQAIELDPDNAEYHYALHVIYWSRMEELNVFRQTLLFSALMKTAANAVALDPKHLPASTMYAALLFVLPRMGGGDKEEGKILMEKIREMGEADALSLEAFLAVRDKQFQLAEELYLKAIEVKGSYPEAELRIAELYLSQKKYRNAITHASMFNRLPKLWYDEDNGAGHLVLAQAYYFLGDEQGFTEHSQEAIKTSLHKARRKTIQKVLDQL